MRVIVKIERLIKNIEEIIEDNYSEIYKVHKIIMIIEEEIGKIQEIKFMEEYGGAIEKYRNNVDKMIEEFYNYIYEDIKNMII